MSVIAKTVTYGIETKIKLIQRDLFASLDWEGTVNVYGKIQPTERNGNIIPEVWLKGQEYKNIFINDKIAATIGFELLNDDNSEDNNEAELNIIFTVKLDKIYATEYSTDKTRRDEKALIEAKRVLENSAYVNQVNDISRGINEVFTNFDTDSIKHRDMHPWAVFSFNCNVTYSNDFCK